MTIFTSINGNKIYIDNGSIIAVFPTVCNGQHCTCLDTARISYIVKEKFEDVVAHLYPLSQPIKQVTTISAGKAIVPLRPPRR